MADAECEHTEVHHRVAVFFHALVLAFESLEVDFEVEGNIPHHAEHQAHNHECARKQFRLEAAHASVFHGCGESRSDKEQRRSGFEDNGERRRFFISCDQKQHEHHDAHSEQKVR